MSNFKKELLSGAFYTAISKYSGILISLVITGTLSRLLSPDDFGIVAIATVIIYFFAIFSDMGVSSAIIQNKTLSAKDLSNIFSFTAWSGLALAMLFFCSSWAIGNYYNSQALIVICQILSLNLFFGSLNIVPNALFYKNKEFKFLAIRSLAIQVIGGTIAIIVALSGGGLYALVVNPILSSIIIFLISIKKYPQKLGFTLGIVTIKKIFSYSAYQFMFNFIDYFSSNLDKMLIGKYLSMDMLGYYEKSYRLMTLPLQNITQVITPVMHPVFSEYQNDLNQLSYSYEKIVRLLAFIGFPLSILLFFTSQELIFILFGKQWEASIPVFQILAFAVGTQIVLSSSGSIYQASGDTKSLFICGLFSSILNVSGIMIGVFFFKTLEAVAGCLLITFSINFIQCYWQMYHVTFKRNMHSFYKQLFSPLLLSLILLGILYITTRLVSDFHIIITLIIKGTVFLIVFFTYIQATNEYNIIRKIKEIYNKKIK